MHDEQRDLRFEDLPEQVQALDGVEQRAWLDTFNKKRAAGADAHDAGREAWLAVLRHRRAQEGG